jgi:two-component system, NtrC family, response regulator AtoC
MRAETILVVDDEKLLRWAIRSELEAQDYRVVEAATVAQAMHLVDEEEPDLVLLDQLLEDGTGLTVLEHIRGEHPGTAVIMITAVDTSDTAVRAMKLGAFDYVTKPIDQDELNQIIARTLDVTRNERRYHALLRASRPEDAFCGIIGDSPAMRRVFDTIGKFARSPASTVLITGESGTGKELAAKAIHALSERRNRPMFTVNCASISKTLMESELFGHERGAFTDAAGRKKGMFELSDGGTLFLDEIGDLPESLQAAFLRVLEQRTFRRVGGEVDISVDVRFIAATNQSLEKLVQEGRFRQDLYYRLNVLQLDMPPLRERDADVLLLAQRFIAEFNTTFRKSFKGLSQETADLFLAHGWPGNVRELRNVLERAVLMDEGEFLFSHSVELGHLHSLDAPPRQPVASPAPPSSGRSLEDIERTAIVQALERAGGNQSEAARTLQISRDTLRYRMKKFDLS